VLLGCGARAKMSGFEWVQFLCSVICCDVGFLESGAFVAFALLIWVGVLAVRQ